METGQNYLRKYKFLRGEREANYDWSEGRAGRNMLNNQRHFWVYRNSEIANSKLVY